LDADDRFERIENGEQNGTLAQGIPKKLRRFFAFCHGSPFYPS